jgi:hypothetical protein
MHSKTSVAVLCATALATAGCASGGSGGSRQRLIDGGNGLQNFVRVGEANWTAIDGAIQATAGGKDSAFLVTRDSYRDFDLRAEFWSSDDANSGIYFRCQDPAKPTDENCYEANIFDQRPDQTYATGALVKVAPVAQPAPKAGGRWNTYEIAAVGTRLVVTLNGVKTVDVRDSKLASGPVGLQWARGTIRFRKLEIRPL